MYLDSLTRPPPRLPPQNSSRRLVQVAMSAALHAAILAVLVLLHAPVSRHVQRVDAPSPSSPVNITHVVFIARDFQTSSGGGGGGGNQQNGPIRHAEGIGRDAITLRIAQQSFVEPSEGHEQSSLPAVLLDARPLASGTQEIVGLPEGGVTFGSSLGSGSGGGVGTGAGTGVGSGSGPGVGPGSGGGIGGGIYRPGGSVTAPRVITQVKPKYTEDALIHKVQGTVTLEMVVTKGGVPDAIRVVRSLDPGGLDAMAVEAASKWRFEPGRLAGAPVDVLVTMILDFRIQ